MHIAPGRVAVILTSVAALLGALAPAVADLDLSSTVGIVAALASITAVVHKWLDGNAIFEENKQSHENSLAYLQTVKEYEA